MADATTTPVWVDGVTIPAADATLTVFDRGTTLGEGVFETLRADTGRVFAVRRHLARLRSSAAALGLEIAWSDTELRAAIHTVVSGVAAAPHVRVRVTVTGGGAPLDPQRAAAGPRTASVVVAAGEYTPWPPSATVCTVPWPWNERSPLAGVKTTSHAEHVLAQTHARRLGCDEGIFADTRGRLCEGTGSNVFVAVGGRLLTPGLASGCLPGVTRALVMEVVDAEEADLPIDVLGRADEIFLTSTTRDVQPVRAVDGRDLGHAGPLTIAAASAYAELVATVADP